jgi:hypothetical protein
MVAAAEILDQVLCGERMTVTIENEAACYQAWQTMGFASMAPTEMALRAGLMADRPAWVFIAGYQAAVRTVFPELKTDGWAAFAATENNDEANHYPGTTLCHADGKILLSGQKSWVAQSRQVDQIVVTINSTDIPSQSVLVDRHAPGVVLSHRPAPKFLADMSQGFAAFNNVEIEQGGLVEEDRRPAFLGCEPKFVLLAAAAFLLIRSKDEQIPALVSLVLSLANYCQSGREHAQTLVALDRLLQDQLALISNTSTIPNWQTDSRLFSMYSSGIKRRADKKRK